MKTEAGTNFDKPVIEVRHAELQRVGDSAYKSACPVCGEGVLAVRRHPVTFELLELDTCLLCGQQFRYLDIKGINTGV